MKRIVWKWAVARAVAMACIVGAAVAQASTSFADVTMNATLGSSIDVTSTPDPITCASINPSDATWTCGGDATSTFSVSSNDTWTATGAPGNGYTGNSTHLDLISATQATDTITLAYTLTPTYTANGIGDGQVIVTAGDFSGVTSAKTTGAYIGVLRVTVATDN